MLMEHETEDPMVEPSGPDDSGEFEGQGFRSADEAGGSGEDDRGTSELAAVREERDRAVAEKAELFDKLQRAQAEFENWRKRLMREKLEQQEYAAMSTIESLLPVVDDFERAINTPGVDPEIKKGLELIHSRIIEAFTRAGMRPVDAEGQFDPHLHHAVDRGPAESDEQDQTILDGYQKGYHFKDRLLRPAMVKVAVKE